MEGKFRRIGSYEEYVLHCCLVRAAAEKSLEDNGSSNGIVVPLYIDHDHERIDADGTTYLTIYVDSSYFKGRVAVDLTQNPDGSIDAEVCPWGDMNHQKAFKKAYMEWLGWLMCPDTARDFKTKRFGHLEEM